MNVLTEKLPLRIFSVDPATGKSGWALLELMSINPLQIRVVTTGELDGAKLFRKRKELSKSFQKQFCILDAFYDEYTDLLTKFNPDYIVSEGAFGYKHMSALISLTLVIHTLRRATKDVLGKDIHEIAPMQTKRYFAGKGNADKEMMRKAYEEEDLYLLKPDEVLTEHQIDAVAHGVGFIKLVIIG